MSELKFVLFLLLLLHPCFVCAEEAAREPVVVSTEEFPPYTSESIKGNGIDCDLIREALKVTGLTVKFIFVPAARSIKMARDGETDATLPWAKRPGREDDFLFSDPVIVPDSEAFFALKDAGFGWDAASHNYGDIKGKSVGAVISYNYGARFEEAEKNGTISVERANSDRINFDKLFGKRFDALISKRMVGRFILKNFFTEEQRNNVTELAEKKESKESDYILISKKSPRAKSILEAINSGLKEIRRSGKYEAMVKAFDNGAYFEKSEATETAAPAKH